MKKTTLLMVAVFICSLFTMTHAQEAVNLVVNGDFETGAIDPWISTNASKQKVMSVASGENAHGGTHYAQYDANATSTQRLEQDIEVTKGKTYTFSFWYNNYAAENQNGLKCYSLSDKNTSSSYIEGGSPAKLAAASEWTKYERTFTATGDTMRVSIRAYESCDIDDISLVEVEGDIPQPGPDYIFSEPFTAGQGDFIIQDVVLPEELTYVWTFDSQHGMKASAYKNKAFASESWLVSPAIDLTGTNNVTLTFDHTVRNLPGNTGALTLLFCTNYTDNVTTAAWETVTIPTWPEKGWNFVTATVNVPAAMQGQANVRFAFKYTSTTDDCNTWEVKNVIVDGEKNSGIGSLNTSEASFFVSGGELIVNNVAEGTMVEIYNALGAKVQATVFDGSAINVSNLTNGVYVVRAGNNVQKMMF